jgi:hypothetical protein
MAVEERHPFVDRQACHVGALPAADAGHRVAAPSRLLDQRLPEKSGRADDQNVPIAAF